MPLISVAISFTPFHVPGPTSDPVRAQREGGAALGCGEAMVCHHPTHGAVHWGGPSSLEKGLSDRDASHRCSCLRAEAEMGATFTRAQTKKHNTFPLCPICAPLVSTGVSSGRVGVLANPFLGWGLCTAATGWLLNQSCPTQGTGFSLLSQQGAPLPVSLAFIPDTYSSSSSAFFCMGFLGCFL